MEPKSRRTVGVTLVRECRRLLGDEHTVTQAARGIVRHGTSHSMWYFMDVAERHASANVAEILAAKLDELCWAQPGYTRELDPAEFGRLIEMLAIRHLGDDHELVGVARQCAAENTQAAAVRLRQAMDPVEGPADRVVAFARAVENCAEADRREAVTIVRNERLANAAS